MSGVFRNEDELLALGLSRVTVASLREAYNQTGHSSDLDELFFRLNAQNVIVLSELADLRSTVEALNPVPFAAEDYESGYYLPTLTNTANLDASTAYNCQYMRVGNVCTVSGRVDVDPTAATTSTEMGISLPLPSAFAGSSQCSGVAFASTIAGEGASIAADTTNARATMLWVTNTIVNTAMFFTFQYLII